MMGANTARMRRRRERCRRGTARPLASLPSATLRPRGRQGVGGAAVDDRIPHDAIIARATSGTYCAPRRLTARQPRVDPTQGRTRTPVRCRLGAQADRVVANVPISTWTPAPRCRPGVGVLPLLALASRPSRPARAPCSSTRGASGRWPGRGVALHGRPQRASDRARRRRAARATSSRSRTFCRGRSCRSLRSTRSQRVRARWRSTSSSAAPAPSCTSSATPTSTPSTKSRASVHAERDGLRHRARHQAHRRLGRRFKEYAA